MSEKEHPARTAGRYVRAAGIAFKKERERLAAESERRAAEAAQAAAQAPPPPAPQAPPAATTPAKAAAPPREQPAPPKHRPFVDRLFWTGFLVTLVATAFALLNIPSVFPEPSRTVLQVGLGCVFLLVAVTLLCNWLQTKDRTLLAVTRKLWGLDHPTTRGGRFMRSIAKDLITLLAIVWLALGVFEILHPLVN
jgi:hypothetical protein